MQTENRTLKLSRRSALAFLAVAPVNAHVNASPSMAASEANSDETTPVMALFARYRAFRAWINSQPLTVPDAEIAPMYAELSDLEKEIMAIPSKTAADVAAKAIVDSGEGDFAQDWVHGAFWKEARELTGIGDAA
jgi:hypothetical protein